MAHFAELDENNKVIYITYMDNEIITDENGNELEELGIKHLHFYHGSDRKWIRASYSGKIREKYPKIGDVYVKEIDSFMDPPPYPSWVINTHKKEWEAPIPKPNGYFEYDYEWLEDSQNWFSIREYVYSKYAKDYEYSHIKQAVEIFSLKEKQIIPMVETEDYSYGGEIVKNFILCHLPSINPTPSVISRWRIDFEDVMSKMNCDTYGVTKFTSEENKKVIDKFFRTLTDCELLGEINNWCIYFRKNK